MAKKTEKTTTRARRRGATRPKQLMVSSAEPRPVANLEVSREYVAVRAYHIFLSRGATAGRELDDWLQAEQELLDESGRLAS